MATPCIACGSDNAAFALSKNGYDIFRCPECDLLFVDPLPPGQDIAELYNSKSTCMYRLKPSFWRDLDRRMIAKWIRRRTSGGKMLEIGCSRGDLLYAASRVSGLEPFGMDLDPAPLELARSRGARVIVGELEQAPFPTETFDVVVAWHILEHLHDPVEGLSAISQLLRPGGRLVACFPSHEHLKARLAGDKWHYFIPPTHLWYFSRPSFSLLCKHAGLTLEYSSLCHYHAHVTAIASKGS